MTQESDQGFRHSFISNTRRDLLPTWIKVFIWIFFVIAAFVPLAVILGLAEVHFALSLYGIETIFPFSLLGLFLLCLFALKGIVSYGLWNEKDWGIQIAIIDAALGLAICLFISFIWPFFDSEEGVLLTFRLEILVLIPYLIKLNKINLPWAERGEGNNDLEGMIETLGKDDSPK